MSSENARCSPHRQVMEREMAEKTADGLKRLRAELVGIRRQEAYRVAHRAGGTHSEHIERLVQVHQAIDALDAVIGESEEQAEGDMGQGNRANRLCCDEAGE